MKKILSTAAVALTLLVPAASFAATYEYVSTDGTLKTVTADTATEALAIPSDIAPHSGVILDTDMTMVPGTVTTTGTMSTGSSGMMMTSSSTMMTSSSTDMTSSSTMMTSSSSDMMNTGSSTMMTSSSSMMTSSSTNP